MNVVVALDSFKGSLSSLEAGNAVKKGIEKVDDSILVSVKPLADGGEGTMRALTEGMNGEYITVKVHGPMGDEVNAVYGVLNGQVAVIEIAEAVGIHLVKAESKNPLKASTYGVGEMILDAMKRGYKSFIIGLGGSITNDGGIGMLQALGFQFLNKRGESVPFGAEGLLELETIIMKDVPEELYHCSFQIACDVNNPLCGENGATFVYGPQKGVTVELREKFDKAMQQYAVKTTLITGKDCSCMAGAGAAGGLGFAFLSYMPSRLEAGVKLVTNMTDLEKSIQNADVVITGEGRLDAQTFMGKAPAGVVQIAQKYGVKVIAIAGSISPDIKHCNQKGICAYFSIQQEVLSLEEAMIKEKAMENLEITAEQIFRILQLKNI